VKKYVPVLLMFIALLSACTTQSSPLSGKWKLTAYGPIESLTEAVADADATLTFSEDGNVAGNSGCNSFGGEYTLKDDQITFGPLSSTLMACDEPRSAQESVVTQVLSETAEFEIKDQTLTITNKGTALVFTAVPVE
jgi:heat shock protein HslJ